MKDWLGILSDPLPIEKAMAFVADPAAGGIAIFAGTTREEKARDGEKLIALDYEAYEMMAEKQFGELSRRARGQWPVVKLVILHRTGRVALAEPSVLIAVSTPHRAEAFAACRWLIDTLKAEATIWKKEIFADGSGEWVEPGRSPATKRKMNAKTPRRQERSGRPKRTRKSARRTKQ